MKIKIKIAVIGCTLAAALPLPALASQPGAPPEIATTYKLNPAHDGTINFAAGFAPPLKQAWSTDVIYNIGSDPALIADGGVFLAAQGNVIRLALDNGRTDFLKSYGAAWLTYDNATLFAVSQQGVLTAMTQDKGKKLWSTQLPRQPFFFTPISAANGQIFAVGEGTGADLFAVDETTGALQWDFPLFSEGSITTIADGALYEADHCRYYKIDPATGQTIWKKTGGGGGLEPPVPVYFNGNVLFADDCNRWSGLVLDASGGKPLSKFNTANPFTPTVFQNSKGNYQGVEMYNEGGVLHSWDIGNKKVLWTFNSDFGLVAEPLVINGLVYTADQQGNIFALDENGKQIWTVKVPVDTTEGGNASLTAGQGTLVFVSGSVVTALVPK